MTREWSVSEQDIGPKNKKQPLMLLHPIATTATVDMEDGDGILEGLDGSGFELSSAVNESYEVPVWTVKAVFLV